MTTYRRFALAVFAAGSLLLARAEPTGVQPASGRSASPLMAALDANRDRVLSAAEIAAAPIVLDALDLNGDGVISPDERQRSDAECRSGRRSPGLVSFNVFFALDANLDDDLQALEIANATSSLMQLDRNRDGQLTHDELRPGRLVADNRN